jgi:hypothetical protein
MFKLLDSSVISVQTNYNRLLIQTIQSPTFTVFSWTALAAAYAGSSPHRLLQCLDMISRHDGAREKPRIQRPGLGTLAPRCRNRFLGRCCSPTCRCKIFQVSVKPMGSVLDPGLRSHCLLGQLAETPIAGLLAYPHPERHLCTGISGFCSLRQASD